MSCQRRRETRLQIVTTGLLFLVSGVLLLTRARGWWQLQNEWAYWPLAFVLPGIHRLVAPPPERSVAAALGWFFTAAVLIAWNLRYIHLRMRDIVPLVCVAVGLRLLYNARRDERAAS